MPQKNWDKYEVALLIEAYQNIKQGRVDKNAALIALSQNLRQMAVNEGLTIDETFRNLNGMQWQLGFIERAFIGEDYESRTPPRIFIEMVKMYNENQAEFQSILAEAHSKIKGNEDLNAAERKQLFVKWLSSNTNLSSNDVVKNIEYVSEYVIKRNISKKNLWDISDYKELNLIRVRISGNKLFKLMHGNEVFTNMYPQIVPTEIYENVRRKTETNKYGTRSVEVVYLLRNKIKCGYCGSPISAECGTAKNG